jgi:hypothetical protein
MRNELFRLKKSIKFSLLPLFAFSPRKSLVFSSIFILSLSLSLSFSLCLMHSIPFTAWVHKMRNINRTAHYLTEKKEEGSKQANREKEREREYKIV